MKGFTRHGASALALAVLILILDQISKYWVVEVFALESRGPTQLAGPLWLSMVWNSGVSFGLLGGPSEFTRWALTIFGFGVAAALAVWVRNADKPLTAAALGCIIGGAIGNAIDRIRYGHVADFIDVSRLHFPWVFNVADAAINIGVGLLILELVLDSMRRQAPS
ncbi:signal peptidase II [Phenylobacterium terrae]|uniref:Lipoprotein signal peptidase n=1 Tax=Phenylobacterium terrae TaxID=2665495 RepID=A0ABW4N587_9CAUL